MKIHCHRPTLAAAFQVAAGVVPSRTPKEICKNLKLQVGDGKAELIGTDTEVGVRCEIAGVEVEQGGEVLVSAQRTMTILRELTADGVNIDAGDNKVTITSGQSRFQLTSEDPAEFPPVPEFDETAYHAMPAGALREAIRRTVFATDVESTRYALGGILLEVGKDSTTLAATDSRRLAVVTAPCRSEGVDEPVNSAPVVPAKAMSLIERSVGDEDGEVLLAIRNNDVLIKSGSSTIYSRLVDGKFPRYRDVVPNNSNVDIEMVAGSFLSAVRQAQIVTNDESRGVDFGFANGTLTLTSRASDIGESTVELPIAYDADELVITFDPKFVADFLRVLEPETAVKLSLIDSESAAVLRTDDGYTYVVMPLSRDRS